MNRRESLKALTVGTISTGILIDACKPADKKKADATSAKESTSTTAIDRMSEEKEHEESLNDAGKFFSDVEMAAISILADIIIPKDEVSGSATDAKVPEFIDFIVRDMPQHQIPMRGGLRWLDMQCLTRYEKAFANCTNQQQIEMVDAIAYPTSSKSEMAQGVAFFNLMRNLTATGFYTSEMGVKDIGYMGNTPNQWNGVPDDVLKQYGLSYSEKELKECVSYDKV